MFGLVYEPWKNPGFYYIVKNIHSHKQYAFNWQNSTSSIRLDWINLLDKIKVGAKYEKFAFSNVSVENKLV